MISAVTYFYLALAIVFEVIATTSLKSSQGLTRLCPSIVAVIGYLITFYFLALTLRTMPIGVAYAIWSGVGILLLATIDWVWFRQALDLPAIDEDDFAIRRFDDRSIALLNVHEVNLQHLILVLRADAIDHFEVR